MMSKAHCSPVWTISTIILASVKALTSFIPRSLIPPSTRSVAPGVATFTRMDGRTQCFIYCIYSKNTDYFPPLKILVGNNI